MMTQLLPEQISRFWSIIKYAVEESVPPIVGEHPDKLNRILSAMLSGKLEVWVSYKKEPYKFEAICVTRLLYDDASDTRNLLIYCLYGYSNITQSSWAEGWETLAKYAKIKRCHSIVAYSANPLLINRAKQLGGDTSYTFISLPINKIV